MAPAMLPEPAFASARYFCLTLDVIDSITAAAILN
jgi:hypothetical protein